MESRIFVPSTAFVQYHNNTAPTTRTRICERLKAAFSRSCPLLLRICLGDLPAGSVAALESHDYRRCPDSEVRQQRSPLFALCCFALVDDAMYVRHRYWLECMYICGADTQQRHRLVSSVDPNHQAQPLLLRQMDTVVPSSKSQSPPRFEGHPTAEAGGGAWGSATGFE